VAPGDAAGIAAALAELAGDPAARAAAGRLAREHVRRAFAAERLVADIDALYRELLAQRAGGGGRATSPR
jgi:glycosyltransferase involved in cell wall biosynthesis